MTELCWDFNNSDPAKCRRYSAQAFLVQVDRVQMFGRFENIERPDLFSGTLQFRVCTDIDCIPGQLELESFTGVVEVPWAVIDILRSNGFVVSFDFQ